MIVIFVVLSWSSFLGIFHPCLLYLIESKDSTSTITKIVYVEDAVGGNGVRIECDDGKRYHFVSDDRPSISELSSLFEEELCEIKFYRLSKIIVRIDKIENVESYGTILTDNEISEIGVPYYPGNDITTSPGIRWLWDEDKLKSNKSDAGYWYKYRTNEVLVPDIDFDQLYGPHWDWRSEEGIWYRLYQDGTVVKLVNEN